MCEPYLAAVVWRLEHATDTDRRVADETSGQLLSRLSRRVLRARRANRAVRLPVDPRLARR
jgi:hypothetical protein